MQTKFGRPTNGVHVDTRGLRPNDRRMQLRAGLAENHCAPPAWRGRSPQRRRPPGTPRSAARRVRARHDATVSLA